MGGSVTAISMPTPSKPSPRDHERASFVERARRALESGQLVGAPSESTYLILAKGGDASLQKRLQQIAGPGKVTWLLDAERAGKLLAKARPPVRRLAARYWPGPLTLALKGEDGVRLPGAAPDEFLYLRAPAGDWLRGLLLTLQHPPAAAEPFYHQKLLFSADELPSELRDSLAVYYDEPPYYNHDAPAMVQIDGPSMRIEREGLLNKNDLLKTSGRRILFVCTGNTCRSPMAQAALRSKIAQMLGGSPALTNAGRVQLLSQFGYRVESAGLAPYPGEPASANAVTAAAQMHYSLEGHRSQAATEELLLQFDLALALTAQHARRLRDVAPPNLQIEPLDPLRDIEDPYGGPLESYKTALRQINDAIERRLPALL